jgi:hypothetical protein
MKDSLGHGSNSKSGLPSWGPPEGLHAAGINAAVGDGGAVVLDKHPKSAPVPLHPGTVPSDESGCRIEMRDGSFVRVDPNNGGACQIASAEGGDK